MSTIPKAWSNWHNSYEVVFSRWIHLNCSRSLDNASSIVSRPRVWSFQSWYIEIFGILWFSQELIGKHSLKDKRWIVSSSGLLCWPKSLSSLLSLYEMWYHILSLRQGDKTSDQSKLSLFLDPKLTLFDLTWNWSPLSPPWLHNMNHLYTILANLARNQPLVTHLAKIWDILVLWFLQECCSNLWNFSFCAACISRIQWL